MFHLYDYPDIDQLLGCFNLCLWRAVFNEKPREKETLEGPRCRWEDNIKVDLQEVGWEGLDWIELAQDSDSWPALVNAVMNLRVQ